MRIEAIQNELVLARQYLETSALQFFGSNRWLSIRFIASS